MTEDEITAADVADARAYGAGEITLEEYRARALARHPVVLGPASPDPVVVYDVMLEAGLSLASSYVWMADHASTEQEEQRWVDAQNDVMDARKRVDARDVEAQRAATAEYIAREQAIRPLVVL